jgi:hypothetical protein
MRIPMVDRSTPAPELQAMLRKWGAEDGDPNSVRTSARLPERPKGFVLRHSVGVGG